MDYLQNAQRNSKIIKEHLTCGFYHDNRKKYKVGGIVFMDKDLSLDRLEFLKKFCSKIVVVLGFGKEELFNNVDFGKNVIVKEGPEHGLITELYVGGALEELRKRGCIWAVYLNDFEIFENRFIEEINNLTTPTQRARHIAFPVYRKVKDSLYTRMNGKRLSLPACRMLRLEKKYEELDYDQISNSWFFKGLPDEANLLSNLRLKNELLLDNFDENKMSANKFVEDEFYLQNTFSEERPTLAMVTMVKNEEKNIARCINSIKPIADEIVIIDTGSTDKTIEIAESLGAKVIHYPWVNDYAEPRNIGLRSTESDWIMILDGDEWLSESDLGKIDVAIRNHYFDAYRMHKRSYVHRLNLRNSHARPENDPYEESKEFAGWIREPVDCLFKNDPRIYYSYNIHEITGRALGEYHFNVSELDIPIHHDGRHDMTGTGKDSKYLKMVERRAEIYPNDGASYYQLGAHHDWFGNSEEALYWFQKSYDCSEDTLSLYGLSLSLMKVGNVVEATQKFEELLELEPWQNAAWGNLIECYFQSGNYRLMREAYEKSLVANPNNINSRLTYATIQLRRNIIIDARDILQEIIKINPTNEEAKLLLDQITGKG